MKNKTNIICDNKKKNSFIRTKSKNTLNYKN